MLPPDLAAQLRSHLTKVTQPVEIVMDLDDSPKSRELHDLLEEVAAMSPAIATVLSPGDSEAARRPSFAINRTGTGIGVRFAGVPMGHEFTSFVLALLQVGGHPAAVGAELIERIARIPGEHHFETFFSLSCQNCPDVVQALNLISVLNPRITHEAIDGALFPQEAQARGVLAVPAVFRDGEPFASGRLSIEEIVDRMAADSRDDRAVEQFPDDRGIFDVLIVGGGPAAATAAVYAARKGLATGLVAQRFGGQLLDTMTIENLPSVRTTTGPKLAADLEQHVADYEVDVIKGRAAAALHPADEIGGLIRVELDNGAVLRTRTVVLATGAEWRTLGVEGEQEYRNRGVTFCPHCDGPLFKGKRVAVVGGGNSGVEAAIDLAGVVDHVTVLEFDDALRADDVLQRTLRGTGNADVVLGALTTAVRGDGTRVTGLDYIDRATGEPRYLDLDGVFVQIGLVANTSWLVGTLDLDDRGEIIVDSAGRTSVPGVFAAGDCTTEPFKQIVVALGAGSTAALSAFEHLIRTPAGV